MKIYGFSKALGCVGGEPYENMQFLNGIWVVWEEIHSKIICFYYVWEETHDKMYSFSKELELWEEETHLKIHCFLMELGLCGRRPIRKSLVFY